LTKSRRCLNKVDEVSLDMVDEMSLDVVEKVSLDTVDEMSLDVVEKVSLDNIYIFFFGREIFFDFPAKIVREAWFV
jgi:hypothetical protein